MAAPRGTTFGNCGGEKSFYEITSRQEQYDSSDVVTRMIKVFTFDVYSFLDPRTSLYFETPYATYQFAILPNKHYELFVFLHLFGSLFSNFHQAQEHHA